MKIYSAWYERVYALPTWVITWLMLQVIKALGKPHPWLARAHYFTLDDWAICRTEFTKNMDIILWSCIISATILGARHVL